MKATFYILATAVLLLIVTYLLSWLGWYSWMNHFFINTAFLVFLTFVVDVINQRALEQEGQGVIIPYLVSTILKLIFSAVFLFFFVRQNIEAAREIVLSFLAYYAFFSAVEIVLVNKRLRIKKF